MNQVIEAIGFIRQLGQLTLPDIIRQGAYWVSVNSPVSLVRTRIDEIIIRPYSLKKILSWEEFYERVKKIRAFKGKGKSVNLSEFLVRDRETHF